MLNWKIENWKNGKHSKKGYNILMHECLNLYDKLSSCLKCQKFLIYRQTKKICINFMPSFSPISIKQKVNWSSFLTWLSCIPLVTWFYRIGFLFFSENGLTFKFSDEVMYNLYSTSHMEQKCFVWESGHHSVVMAFYKQKVLCDVRE